MEFYSAFIIVASFLSIISGNPIFENDTRSSEPIQLPELEDVFQLSNHSPNLESMPQRFVDDESTNSRSVAELPVEDSRSNFNGPMNFTASAEDPYRNELNRLEETVSILEARQIKMEESLSGRLAYLENITRNLKQITDHKFMALDYQARQIQSTLDDVSSKLEDAIHTNRHTEPAHDASSATDNTTANNYSSNVATKRLVDGRMVSEYLWFVHEIDKAVVSGAANNGTVLKCEPFYVEDEGYRMRVVLHPNYKGRQFIGLFAGLVPGKFDDKLKWPFSYDFQLSVVSHIPHVPDDSGTVKMSTTKCSPTHFMRPENDMSHSFCGFGEFMSHEKIKKNQSAAYRIHGGLMIRFRVFLT